MKYFLVLLTLSCWACAVMGDYEIIVAFNFYANPSGRCVDCNGATPGNPACCDTSYTVPQTWWNCPTFWNCDTRVEFCFRAVGTTGPCTQSPRILTPSILSGPRSYIIENLFFGSTNPVELSFNGPWQGKQIYLTPHECDRPSRTCPGIIDSIPIDIDIAVGTSIPRTTYNGVANIAHVNVTSIEVRCADGFYGQDCSTQCSNFVSCAGCGLSGFTGQFCQFSINNCSNEYCNGLGNCVQGSRQCICDTGYTGDRCETNIDDCVGGSCNNNGMCVDLINNFRCKCHSGFTGSHCETNINDCSGINCTNGMCIDQINSFRCECSSGFTGSRCETDINECNEVDCNNGTCVDQIGSFMCNCNPGFTGDHCETNINDCDGVNCNNGVCVDQINSFRCDCNSGFIGNRCETNINDCDGVNCNNGVCRDEVNAFECGCNTGFTGNRCETNINDCDGVNCNNGVCRDELNNFRCDCNPGFTGNHCQTNIDDCDGVDCNGGECRDQVNGFSCDCNPGFTGEFCQIISVAAASKNVISIAGGTVGAAIGVILLIIIVIVVAMVIKSKGSEKRSHKGPADETVIRDNPSYDTRFVMLTNSLESAHYQEIPTSRNNPQNQEFSIASLQVRDFDNPIYGSAEHEREVHLWC